MLWWGNVGNTELEVIKKKRDIMKNGRWRQREEMGDGDKMKKWEKEMERV